MLSEHLRPRELGDLIQPRPVVEALERMATEGRLRNVLFYGQPGLGKTSAARILIEQVEADTLQINGSLDTGIDTFRTVFVSWASACSLFNRQKVCFIDEADYLSSNAQAALRGLIEAYPNVAFLLTANDFAKIDPALKSRCLPVWFDFSAEEEPEAIARLCARYERRLRELSFLVNPRRLGEIVREHFPDLRAIANQLEFEFPRNKEADGSPEDTLPPATSGSVIG